MRIKLTKFISRKYNIKLNKHRVENVSTDDSYTLNL